MQLLDMPEDVLEEVLSHARVRDALSFFATSKAAHKIKQNGLLWRRLYAKHFPELPVPVVDEFEKFKTTYFEYNIQRTIILLTEFILSEQQKKSTSLPFFSPYKNLEVIAWACRQALQSKLEGGFSNDLSMIEILNNLPEGATAHKTRDSFLITRLLKGQHGELGKILYAYNNYHLKKDERLPFLGRRRSNTV